MLLWESFDQFEACFDTCEREKRINLAKAAIAMINAVGADGNDMVLENDEERLSMSDIYYLLLADLTEVSDLVENARTHANENQPLQSWSSTREALRKEFNNPQDVQTAIKKSMLEAVSKSVKNAKPLGEPLYTAHVSLELRAKLLERVKEDRMSIQNMSFELSQLQDSNNEYFELFNSFEENYGLLRRIEDFNKMATERASSGEMKSKLKWQEISKKVKAKRAKLVKDVRYVTKELCQGSDIENLLAELLKKSVTGSDPYVNVNDETSEDVEFLLRCNLIVRHPHSRDLIRLRDLI